MLNTDTLKKVIIVPVVAVGVMASLTACVAGPLAVPGEKRAGTLTAAGTAAACEHVDAPMLDIPVASDAEPRMRIPQPAGWERTTELDDLDVEFRFAISDTAEVAGERPQTVAVVTVDPLPDLDAQVIFDEFRTYIADTLDAQNMPMDMQANARTVCGHPAETLAVTNHSGAMGAALGGRGVPVTTLSVVAKTSGQTYLITVITTSQPGSAKDESDVEQILTGFQVLSPAAGQRA